MIRYKWPLAWPIFLGFLLLGPLCWAGPDLQIISEKWNLHGGIEKGRVNRLSILISNEGDEPYRGVLKLQRGGVISKQGMPELKPFTLSPDQKKWAHFLPIPPANSNTGWTLNFDAISSVTIALPRGKRDAAVYITQAGDSSNNQVATSDATHFPSTVLGLDSMRQIALAHDPDWSKKQRIALRDWVEGGGHLTLIDQSDRGILLLSGVLRQFSEQLQNSSDNECFFGAGKLLRSSIHRDLFSFSFSTPSESAIKQAHKTLLTTAAENSESIISNLFSEITRPTHNWVIIGMLILGLVFFVGPANWILGRKVRNHWISLGFLVTTVTVFSGLFFWAGNSGFSAVDGAHIVSYVRPVRNSVLSHDWIHLFATTGGTRSLRSNGRETAYSSLSDHKSVRGYSLHGQGAELLISMPLLSSQSFLGASKSPLTEKLLEQSNISWSNSQSVTSLDVKIGPGITGDVHWAALCQNSQLFKIQIKGSRLLLVSPLEEISIPSPDNYYSRYNRDQRSQEFIVQDLQNQLILYAKSQLTSRSTQSSLFVFSKGTKSNFVGTKIINQYTLYQIPLTPQSEIMTTGRSPK